MAWKTVKLGDLYEVHNGLSKGAKFFGSGYPFLSFKTVFNNYFLPEELTDLVQTTDKERQNFDIRRGDVFITRTSETAEELGMSSVALNDHPDATYNGFTKRLRPKGSDVVPEFIGYYLRSSMFRNIFYGLASSMSTRASLSNGDLLNMPISLPSIEIQQRIADILYSLDSKIYNNNRINRNLEDQARTIYKSWFIDLEPWGGIIPKDWKDGVLGDIIEEQPKSKVQVNAARDVKGLYPFYTSGTSVYEYNEALVHGRNIFLNTGGAAGVEFYVGSAAYSTDTWCIKGKENLSDYLYLYLSSMIDIINAEYFEGSALKHLQKKPLKERTIIMPNREVIDEFNKLVVPLFDSIYKNTVQNKSLLGLRDALLPKLMKGEIEL